MAYQAFRENGFPTFYAENKTAWQADLIEAGLIFAFCILAFSFYVILPGIRGKEKLFTFIRVTLSLYIGAVILISNFAYTWETSEIHTRTKYKAGEGREISADIGVHIGLRGINITLKGSPNETQLGEKIDYNEHFSWEWTQGRLGFGPFAGPFNQEYRAAQFRGLPLPILWIAEYFTFDGEGIRWGRHYRQAGWFSHIMLWLCFPLWLLTNIFFFVLLRYGAYFLAFTGLCMITANIIWATIRNYNELKIPFEDGIMEFSFGGAFYVCLITGIICVILGIIIVVLDLRCPTKLVTFFSADVLQDADDVVHEEDDGEVTLRREKDLEMKDMDGAPDASVDREPMKPPIENRGPAPLPQQAIDEDDELYEAPPPPNLTAHRYEKKQRGLTMRFQKSRRHRPPPPPPIEEDLYVNQGYGDGAGAEDIAITMQ